MKVKQIRLREFKRFTNLTITGIPETARIVVLIGPNGCGKSSVFDAFNWHLNASKGEHSGDGSYYAKSDAATVGGSWTEIAKRIQIEFYDHPEIGESPLRTKKAFYVRSCYRNEADFSINQLERNSPILDDNGRPIMMMSDDKRVSENYKRIIADTIAQVFDLEGDDNTTRKMLREELIGKVQTSLKSVFGDLLLEGPGNPLSNGTFFFEKGLSKNWKYKNLSAGEKAAFDLLLDFQIKSAAFDDTVYCIDEPELHMHSSLQGALLGELFTKLPEKCQLWIATHSIGMLRKAQALSVKNPGAIVFLDFAGHDCDKAIPLTPSTPNRTFWKKVFSVAIGDLADLIAPRQVVCCEGGRHRNGEFDAKCYRKIFETEFPDIEFLSLGGASEVEKHSLLISSVFRTVLSGLKVTQVIDRDDRGQAEIAECQTKGIRVLSMRHLECYLYSDEILGHLCAREEKSDKLPEIISEKNRLLDSSILRGNPSDHIKSVSGELYNAIKRILHLKQCGNTSEAFCIQTLAPLVKKDTNTYTILKNDIFPED